MKLAKHVVSTNLMDERLAFSCSWSNPQTPKTRHKRQEGHETEPSIPLITTSYVEAPIWRASVCLAVKTVSITKPEKHFSAHTGAKPALMWTIKFSVPENEAVCNILQCNFPLIQVNGSALSCFSDLRRQMFRPGLISNVIWNVISNCLSQSGLELNLSF